jgi:hypothetical protein
MNALLLFIFEKLGQPNHTMSQARKQPIQNQRGRTWTIKAIAPPDNGPELDIDLEILLVALGFSRVTCSRLQ